MRSVAAGGAPNPAARVGTGTREITAADRRSVARELRDGAAGECLLRAHVEVRCLPARETEIALEILRRLWERETHRGREIRSKKWLEKIEHPACFRLTNARPARFPGAHRESSGSRPSADAVCQARAPDRGRSPCRRGAPGHGDFASRDTRRRRARGGRSKGR